MRRFKLLLIAPLLVCGCSSKNDPDDKTIVVGASSTPHALILEHIKPYVEDEGYKLDIRVISDYVTPNLLLAEGDLDANYFQHEPYLNDFNANHDTALVSAFKVHFEPMGIYSKKRTDLNDSYKSITVAIPNDKSNGDRARDLLALYQGFDNATIIELEAQALPSVLDDVDYACINGNYALSANVVDYCLVTESNTSTIAQTNANIIAVRNKYKDAAFVQVLKDCLLSDHTRNFIQAKFGSSVIPMF